MKVNSNPKKRWLTTPPARKNMGMAVAFLAFLGLLAHHSIFRDSSLEQSTRTVANSAPIAVVQQQQQQHQTAPANEDAVVVNSKQGTGGGSWTWCTHIRTYGFNFDLGLASFIADQLHPTSTFEFGSGIGLYSEYMVRYGNVLGRAIAAEPEDMSDAGILNTEAGVYPQQITGNLLDASRQSERERLGKFDVVFSIEVAEHLDPSQIPALEDFFKHSVGKYLVFFAARPGQGGSGHIRGSMFTRQQWIEKLQTDAGLSYIYPNYPTCSCSNAMTTIPTTRSIPLSLEHLQTWTPMCAIQRSNAMNP